jgi:hypothetical protein
MEAMTTETQESRRDTVSAAVTATEKWAIQLVKRKTGRDISDLLRTHNLDELIEWGLRIDRKLEELRPTG